MQLEIIYVNKSTILPLDYKMKGELNSIINHSLLFDKYNKLNQLNIFFVSEVELYTEIMKRDKATYKFENLSLFDIEYLGVYIEKSDELNGQILIKISPERILYSTFEFKKKWNLKVSNLEIYKILLTHVVLKQLGHYALSRSYFIEYPFSSSILEELDNLDEYPELLYSGSYSNFDYRYYEDYFIEYSLVNRFSLEHNWSLEEKEIIWKFIESEYDRKSSITCWKETANFIDTFQSWKIVKNKISLKEYLTLFDRHNKIFNTITEKFKNNENIASCNFESIYIEHIQSVVNSPEIINLNDNRLIDFSGVYSILIEYFTKNNYSEKVLKYCKQYLNKLEPMNNTAYTKTYMTMADASKNNPQKCRKYLILALSYTKDTFPAFKESYVEIIEKKLKELEKAYR